MDFMHITAKDELLLQWNKKIFVLFWVAEHFTNINNIKHGNRKNEGEKQYNKIFCMKTLSNLTIVESVLPFQSSISFDD